MKIRYFILPILIISLIVLILTTDDNIINKEVSLVNGEVIYPFFGNKEIDKYIDGYLNKYNKYNDYLIDYDLIKEKDLYYLTFYSNYLDNNVSFEINLKKNTIDKIPSISYEYDFYNYNDKNKNTKYVALTFDDGPNYNTNKVLDILDKYSVPATFFVLGKNIKGNEDIIKRMDNLGMEIGNHTFSHELLTKKKKDKIKLEIDTTNKMLFDITGKYPTLLRPSYGSFNKKIRKASDMPIIIWDIDTLDWKYHNSKKIVDRVVNKVKDGDIILMHDIYSASANALDSIIPMLREMGYTFVTVSDLFYIKGVSLEKGKVYGCAR